MQEQLRYLVRQAAHSSVCLQVVPASVGTHTRLSGSFNVLEFGEPDEPAIAYLENAVTAMYVHKEAEVREYKVIFDRLQSEALSPPDSLAFVERLVDDLCAAEARRAWCGQRA